MSRTKLRSKPIAEQIAAYEMEIARIDEHIANGRKQQRELRRHIRILQRPDAEERYQKRLAQHQRQTEINNRSKEDIARRHARMQREVEECLRMNGKII